MLCFFTAKKGSDRDFYYKNSIAQGNQMGNLLWANSISRFDYQCFYDVIAFNFAFKRNKYNYPLVLVIGINHHHQMIIFNCGILVHETTENYSWILDQLVQCMGGKKPCAVVTDGVLRMCKAIKDVLPEATHCLCSFHLQRNAMIHVKNPNFVKDFSKVMFARADINRFESDWRSMVEEYNLNDNEWMNTMWESCKMCAKAYLKDKFFRGTCMASRCESMHSSFNKIVGCRLPFSEFVERFDSILSIIRHKEFELDHKSDYKRPTSRTPFYKFEFQAAKVYTAESFLFYQEERNEAGAYKNYAPY